MKFVFVKNHLEGLEPSFYSSPGNMLLSNLQFTRFKQLRKSFLKTPEANHITPEMSSLIQSFQQYQPARSSREKDEVQPTPPGLQSTSKPPEHVGVEGVWLHVPVPLASQGTPGALSPFTPQLLQEQAGSEPSSLPEAPQSPHHTHSPPEDPPRPSFKHFPA